MPKKYGQVTEKDFKAPKGKFRIIFEDMDDGDLEIVADYHKVTLAQNAVEDLRKKYGGCVITLWDDRSQEVLC